MPFEDVFCVFELFFFLALFCQSCREELSLKKQNIAVHVSSKKHKANKEKMEKTTKKERHIDDAIAKYDEAH